MMAELRYDGLVVLVTGAGAGLGRQYALDFAARGASVVVNDLGGSTSGAGSSSKPADHVVNEIIKNGGKAAANYDSVEFGEKLIKTAIDKFGKIDIVINNAGILRDKSFVNMSQDDWDVIQKVHLKGAFSVTKAAWPYMKEQKFGRVIFTASPSGLYGNFGQANYSAAKLGLLGLCNTLSIEGQRYNINCNTIAPTASSRLTQSVLPPQLHEHLKPEYISPLVLYLSHPDSDQTGGVFELAGGWISKLRWQRSHGAVLRRKSGLMTPEMVREHFETICDFTNCTFPADIRSDSAAHVASIMEDLESQFTDDSVEDQNIVAKEQKLAPSIYEYTDKDTRFYALSVGVKPRNDDLKFVYEQHDEFCVLPTYSVIPAQGALTEFITNPPPGLNFDFANLLHGEQYTQVLKPLPSSGVLRNEAHIMDILDKGSGAVVILDVKSYDQNDDLIAFNQFVIFLRGSGGFGGKSRSSNQQPLAEQPSRAPDASVTELIEENQAALYRLNGDPNPIHIDPDFAALGGFDRPILHGLCTYAIACRHVIKTYGHNDVTKFKAMKARFSKPVVMGQTVKTEMWREGNKIHFLCKVQENDQVCLEGGYVELYDVTSEPNHHQVIEGQTSTTPSSDGVFMEIKKRLANSPELAEKINAVFLWNITDSGGEVVRKWTMDLRGGEPVYSGEPRTGKVACTFTVSDQDMVSLVRGKLNPQKAFLSGKLKIKGNLALVQKLSGLFRDQSKL